MIEGALDCAQDSGDTAEAARLRAMFDASNHENVCFSADHVRWLVQMLESICEDYDERRLLNELYEHLRVEHPCDVPVR